MSDQVANTSSAEIEQQMYQAMAEKMKSDGLDVTAEDVQQVVDEQTSEKPPEPDEKDQQILEKMAEYQEEYQRQNPTYVVRGALLQCKFGSHCRRLNLPKCHGVYALKHPVMSKPDCKAGVEGPGINITTFGVCSSPDNQTGGNVCLEKEAPRNPDGSFTGESVSGVVRGTPCVPIIVGFWEDTHDDTLIGKEKKEALTTNSFLMCLHGGIISVIRSGQEDED